MARARFFPVSAQMCHDPALTGPSLYRGADAALPFPQLLCRYRKIHDRGVRLELRPMRRKERPHITDVRRTRKKPSREFIAGRHVSQIRMGKQLDADIERDIAKLPQAVAEVQVRQSSHVAAVRLYAYVHREVTSAAARLDQFLSRNGVASDERVTVISDDAGEFAKTVEDSQLARGRILEWFHIAMKFQAAQRSVFGEKSGGDRIAMRQNPVGTSRVYFFLGSCQV
jgi:hypothetical protein